ncbi:phage tail protein [Solimonas sp. K1W22B-7]|uniref:phage tail protein n=1 Tax=Solimonas sp. K1W22B-7 TaxID=2303331 RepID=UPI000E32F812|nr:tail fiber protein [Solimonas sp. K1W22B-7]AXQ29313.1 phage tail protein [Solimonas sp. K1W22B-7]
MSEPFLGMISIFGFNFAPRGWAFCNGQILPIAQSTALFSLLGTTYGGNGQTTYALPNLQGRMPMHFGNGPGLSSRNLGEMGGTESTTLTQAQMPSHSHTATVTVTASLYGETATASALNPLNNMLASPAVGNHIYAPPVAADNKLMAADSIKASGTATIGLAGGNQPFGIMPPFLALNFCIALEGIFPSRN